MSHRSRQKSTRGESFRRTQEAELAARYYAESGRGTFVPDWQKEPSKLPKKPPGKTA